MSETFENVDLVTFGGTNLDNCQFTRCCLGVAERRVNRQKAKTPRAS